MGLDMYLEGRLFQWTDWTNPERNEQRDGKKIKNITVDLGYWRKHPDLHGYIVNEFAEGKDNCNEIYLSPSNVEKIIEAIKTDNLAHKTKGFFFGESFQPGGRNEFGSYDEQKASDLEIFHEALNWYNEMEKKYAEDRLYAPDLVYQASW